MKRSRSWIGLIIVLLWAGVTARAVQRHLDERRDWTASTESAARQAVTVARPAPAPKLRDLVLPADVQALLETPIYARTNGYLKRWYTGMGTTVKAGQLLADIDTPEVDQELLQAEAAAAQAEANLDLARKTDVRWQALLKTHAVAQQEADQYRSQLHAREADVRAARANVQRLRALQGFKQVRAPFDGIVTARTVDVGALIASGNSQPLFRVAQAHTLRVYVQVPQSASTGIRAGLDASLEIPEFPGRRFPGKVTSTAGAIDPATRTLNTEVQVPNPGGELLPGTFGRIRFQLESKANILTIPATALIFRGQGAQVAIVNRESKVMLRPVKLGRDLGTSLEVVDGIGADDRVVLNPSDSLDGGELVEVRVGETGAEAAGN